MSGRGRVGSPEGSPALSTRTDPRAGRPEENSANSRRSPGYPLAATGPRGPWPAPPEVPRKAALAEPCPPARAASSRARGRGVWVPLDPRVRRTTSDGQTRRASRRAPDREAGALPSRKAAEATRGRSEKPRWPSVPQTGETGCSIGSEDDSLHLEQGCGFTPHPPATADSCQRSRIRRSEGLLLLTVVPALRQPTRASPGTLLSARRLPGPSAPVSPLAGGTCGRTSPEGEVSGSSDAPAAEAAEPSPRRGRSTEAERPSTGPAPPEKAAGPAGSRRGCLDPRADTPSTANRGPEGPCVRVPSVPGRIRPAAGRNAGHSEEGPALQSCGVGAFPSSGPCGPAFGLAPPEPEANLPLPPGASSTASRSSEAEVASRHFSLTCATRGPRVLLQF